jgi:large subunit ribosomal protein L9
VKVMLTKDVDNLGQAGDVKEVKDGFGRNFLLRRKLAVLAGRGVEDEAKRIRDATDRREAKDRMAAEELAEEISNRTVVCRLRMGEGGRVFGAVTNDDIAEALKAQHQVEIDRRRIELPEPIKQLGEHQVTLRLHRDVPATINLVVTQDR